MRQVVAVVLGLGIIALTTPGVVRAADQCPAELAQAKAALKSAQAQAKSQDIQSPRCQAGARSQDIQAPRPGIRRRAAGAAGAAQPAGHPGTAAAGDAGTPEPAGHPGTAAAGDAGPACPAGAPRRPGARQDIQAPRVKQAAALVQQSDAACKKGDMTLSAKKAREALGLLKK